MPPNLKLIKKLIEHLFAVQVGCGLVDDDNEDFCNFIFTAPEAQLEVLICQIAFSSAKLFRKSLTLPPTTFTGKLSRKEQVPPILKCLALLKTFPHGCFPAVNPLKSERACFCLYYLHKLGKCRLSSILLTNKYFSTTLQIFFHLAMYCLNCWNNSSPIFSCE